MLRIVVLAPSVPLFFQNNEYSLWTASIEWANHVDKKAKKEGEHTTTHRTKRKKINKNRAHTAKWMNATSTQIKLKYHLNYASCEPPTKYYTEGEWRWKKVRIKSFGIFGCCWKNAAKYVDNFMTVFLKNIYELNETTKSTYRYTFTFNTIHNAERRSQVGIPCWA